MFNNVEELRNAYTQGEAFEYVLFWGHAASKDGLINASCLSQWWPCTFVENDVTYANAEQYMMAGKANLFNDTEILKQILDTCDPKAVKALGRKVKNFKDDVWKLNRFNIVA